MFFSTHILPDVEVICDRVAIIAGGQIQEVGPLARCSTPRLLGTEIAVRVRAGESLDGSSAAGVTVRDGSGDVTLVADAEIDVTELLARWRRRAQVLSVTPRHETLEDLFLRQTREAAS